MGRLPPLPCGSIAVKVCVCVCVCGGDPTSVPTYTWPCGAIPLLPCESGHWWVIIGLTFEDNIVKMIPCQPLTFPIRLIILFWCQMLYELLCKLYRWLC